MLLCIFSINNHLVKDIHVEYFTYIIWMIWKMRNRKDSNKFWYDFAHYLLACKTVK